MSISTCSLSGHQLVNPVVSIKTGHIFEKSTITKHLQNTGQCPITGIDLNAETDLLEVQSSQIAQNKKPLSQNSVPNMLYSMQTEWDCAMLEIYNMRKDLSDTKKELAHALY